MRTDGRDSSRFAPRHGLHTAPYNVPRITLPLIDHEAQGPISALMRLVAWLGRWRGSQPAF